LGALVLLGTILLPAVAAAQSEAPAYKPLRYDEDYSYLSDPQKRTDFWDPIKYIPLGNNPNTYLSFGGELRERAEYYSAPAFGLGGGGNDGYLFHRLLLSADLHATEYFRIFVQLGDELEVGKDKPLSPTDVDRLDLQQGFADVRLPITSDFEPTLRAGRQEMSFGSQRLVSVREPPNVRRSFDGFRFFDTIGAARIDAFVTRPVELERGVFDAIQTEPQARIKNFGGNAVGHHVLHAFDRIPTARAGHGKSGSTKTLQLFGPLAGTLTVAIGLVDLPLRQDQETLMMDFGGAHGHLAVVGAPRTGRSTLLRTVMLSSMLTHSPAEMQFYCIDYGGGTLQPYATAPHVGSVAGRNDPELVTSIMDTGANACLARATNPEEIYRAILACGQSGFYFDNLIEKVGLTVNDVKRIYRKAIRLSEKEFLLLQLLAEDMLTKDISKTLRLSSRRVEAIRQDIKAKIGAKTIGGLIAFGVRNKLID